MIYIEAPQDFPVEEKYKSIFIAGTITGSSNWQKLLIKDIEHLPLIVMNPRRSNFPIDCDAYEQIKWEFECLNRADMVSFWFSKETLSPISLFELGAATRINWPVFIGMDPEYKRRIDVEIQMSLLRPEINIVYNLKDLADQIKKYNK